MNVEAILASKGREVRTIEPEATVGQAIRRLCAERVGALVVSSDGAHIVGIISDRGITCAIAEHGIQVVEATVASIMTPHVITCTAEDTVAALMSTMTERRIRHLPVVDGQGRLAGMISIGDVVKHRLDEIQWEADAMRDYIAGVA